MSITRHNIRKGKAAIMLKLMMMMGVVDAQISFVRHLHKCYFPSICTFQNAHCTRRRLCRMKTKNKSKKEEEKKEEEKKEEEKKKKNRT